MKTGTPEIDTDTAASITAERQGPVQRLFSWLMSALLVVVVAGFITAAVAVASGSWQADPVLSGSMEPALPTGGLVITQRVPVDELAEGDVLLFHTPDQQDRQVVHRITEIEDTPSGQVLTTKGDANQAEDPWRIVPTEDTALVARASVPYVGHAALATRSPEGKQALLVGGGLAILGGGVLVLGSRNRTENPDRPAGGISPAAALAS